MSTEDEAELLHTLRTQKTWLKAFSFIIGIFGMGIVGAAAWVIAVATTDHFDQISLRKDSDWMMPRVTQLWYHGNKEPDDGRNRTEGFN